MTTTPTVRYVGVTDECIECQKCGKADLRSTVVLAILDTDGNDEEITYYGSTCAARALAERGVKIRGGSAAILQSARRRTEQLRLEAAEARGRLAKYGLPEKPVMLTPREWRPVRWAFVENNTRNQPVYPYGHPLFEGPEIWQARLEECITAWWATLTDAALIGIEIASVS